MTDSKNSGKILIVVTSNDKLGDTGKKTGAWLEEIAAPYYKFKEAGLAITLASPLGGTPPIDAGSLAGDFLTEECKKFQADAEAQQAFKNTTKLADIDAAQFGAVFYPGGHGPIWDLKTDNASIAIIEAMDKAGKPIGAVCHGPIVFKNPKAASGEPLVKGKNVTGFSNAEEKAVGLAEVCESLEDMLKENGGKYSAGDNWASHVQTDGNLVTGQNPGSSAATAAALVQLLKA